MKDDANDSAPESPFNTPDEQERLLNRTIAYYGGGLVPGGTAGSFNRYYVVMNALLTCIDVDEAEWCRWFNPADAPPCQIFAWIGGPRNEVFVRRSARRVLARVDRAIPNDLSTPTEDDAWEDATKLVGRLRTRFGLDTPPEFKPDPGLYSANPEELW